MYHNLVRLIIVFAPKIAYTTWGAAHAQSGNHHTGDAHHQTHCGQSKNAA